MEIESKSLGQEYPLHARSVGAKELNVIRSDSSVVTVSIGENSFKYGTQPWPKEMLSLMSTIEMQRQELMSTSVGSIDTSAPSMFGTYGNMREKQQEHREILDFSKSSHRFRYSILAPRGMSFFS